MEGLNTDKNIFSTPDNKHYLMDEFKTLFEEDLVEPWMQFIAKSRRLDLKKEERALLRAISNVYR